MAKREARSARSGKFMTLTDAKLHPAETVVERNTISPRKRNALDAAMASISYAMGQLADSIAKLDKAITKL